MLAEMGAEVIKIEDPRGGDPLRHFPPLLDGRGVYDLLLNRGKKSVALDLRTPGNAAALDRLVARADIVVESFRPATARRLGVSAAQLRAQHPRLIHCSITGYGQTGPYAERPGHDLNYVALSGVLGLDRPAPAALPRVFVADVGGGAMSSIIGILAALYARDRTGEGAAIDLSMHEAALYWLMLPAARELVDEGHRATADLPVFGSHACYNVYETRDGGQVALGALEPKFWTAFCRAIGREDLVARHDSPGEDQAVVLAEVRRIFASRSRDEWLALFRGHDVALTPVNRPSEALDDPHVAARGAVVRGRGLRAVRPPFAQAVADLSPAPGLGEHTAEVLRDW
jgi:crotonobetainyl-CoA:carnitine CoA-transferase CaiB-like acyl-CoA transferase